MKAFKDHFHPKFPEPANEHIFAILQGLFYRLEEGVDYPGRLSLCENVLDAECFHDSGFGQSH
jgi:hypothetical protein